MRAIIASASLEASATQARRQLAASVSIFTAIRNDMPENCTHRATERCNFSYGEELSLSRRADYVFDGRACGVDGDASPRCEPPISHDNIHRRYRIQGAMISAYMIINRRGCAVTWAVPPARWGSPSTSAVVELRSQNTAMLYSAATSISFSARQMSGDASGADTGA